MASNCEFDAKLSAIKIESLLYLFVRANLGVGQRWVSYTGFAYNDGGASDHVYDVSTQSIGLTVKRND